MRYEIYKAKDGGYRWRLVAANNKIIADGGESYSRARDVRRALRSLAWAAIRARVVGM